MALDEDLRTELIAASATLGQRVHQNMVPQQQANTFPRCWFTRTGKSEELDLSAGGGLIESEYTAEFISEDLDEAVAAADAARRLAASGGLHGKRGTFGSGSIQGCFVEDQDDDYIPRGLGEGTADGAGLHVSALRIRIFST